MGREAVVERLLFMVRYRSRGGETLFHFPGRLRGNAGSAPRRASPEEIILFDSTGTALQDAAAALAVYERALAAGRGARFPFWG